MNDYKKLFKTKRLKKQGDDKEMEIAYHEAGHALMDLLYGIVPQKTTIISNHDYSGINYDFHQGIKTRTPWGEEITEAYYDIGEFMFI
jgi:ATP-dependent Zn protease